jgi:hypothetical protein
MILEDKLTESAPYMRVARRKGRKVRLQNVSTGRMGRWITDPYATEQEPVVATVRALSLTELERMRVKDLRSWAERHYGESFKSKARKAEMVGAILALQNGRAK